MKNKPKNKMLNNFGYKILSIFFAILLWIVVMNISDATITKQINDIPVEQLNGDVLEELDKIYDVSSGDTVDIIVKGRRSIVGNLSADDFKATADLSTMSITNSVAIKVYPKDSNIEDDISITCVDNTMKLNLEERVTVQFPVKIKTIGSVSDGFAVGIATAAPNIVTVQGPKSSVEKITEVCAVVSVDGVHKDFEKICDIVMYDAYGEVINNDKLSVSENQVNVNIVIYPVKTVDVFVKVTGTPASGYGVKDVIYQPQTITIAGAEDKLKYIHSIQVDDIHISGIKEDLQTTIDLKNYLDEGIIIADTDTQVVVTVDIEEVKDKTFTLTDKSFTLTNRQNGYKYKVTLSNNARVIISGVSDVIDGINLTDLKLAIDCEDYPIGMNSNCDVQFKEIDGVEVKLDGSVNVEVTKE